MSGTILHAGATGPFVSIALPLALASLLAGAVALKSGIVDTVPPSMPLPETVTVPVGTFKYREAGEFFRAGFAVDAPKAVRVMRRPIEIMKYQVSAAEYEACVADGACRARESKSLPRADLPATGVNYDDAQAYARWLSDKTGESWRLPEDAELAYAAGSKYLDDALGVDPDSKNPALRWLADYDRESARKASREPDPQTRGHFGENEHGLADFGGNVWEWTTTCNRRVNVDRKGNVLGEVESCGIYVAAGKHRAPLSSFVRDPKGGGCSVGTPPEHVGIRLVQDTRWYAPLLFAIWRPSM